METSNPVSSIEEKIRLLHKKGNNRLFPVLAVEKYPEPVHLKELRCQFMKFREQYVYRYETGGISVSPVCIYSSCRLHFSIPRLFI